MSLAYTASDMVAASVSRQFTAWSALLLGLVFLAMAGIAVWSWIFRYQLDVKRRLAEAALRVSQSRLTQLSSQLPVALFSFLPHDRFDTVSDGIIRLLPTAAEQLLADSSQLLQHIVSEDRSGLEWLAGQQECPAQLDWIGRVAPGDAPADMPCRWLQIRASMDIDSMGRRVFTGVMIDVTALKTAQLGLEASRQELRQLAIHREREREQEYRHLAREFHDELGQILTSARMQLQLQLQLLEQRLNDPVQARINIEKIDTMLGEAYRSVKSIATALRPPALNLGLPAAIEWQAERVLAPAGLKFTISHTDIADTLPDAIATPLFRIVQEAFSNIIRHAKSTSVHVSVRSTTDGLRLCIADDGVGFDLTRVNSANHFGLIGMRERICALGGMLDIDSAIGEGTRLSVSVPLHITEELNQGTAS